MAKINRSAAFNLPQGALWELGEEAVGEGGHLPGLEGSQVVPGRNAQVSGVQTA